MTFTDGFARGVAALALSIGAVGAGLAQEPAPRTLHALTVPEARLPEGCGFGQAPVVRRTTDPASGKVVLSLGDSSGRPFVTTSRPAVAAIRQEIDRVSFRLPDAPPDAVEAGRLRARWVEHVIVRPASTRLKRTFAR